MSQAPTRATRLTWVLLGAAIVIPVGFAVALSRLSPDGTPLSVHASPVSHFPPTALAFDQQPLGPSGGFRPRITNVRIVDLDKDGRPEVLVCDAQRNRVFLYRQGAGSTWEEQALGDEVNCPAGATPADLDGDGDLDLVVAVLGSVLPADDRIGGVVWLENQGGGKFVNHTLLDNVRRVSDVQAADLDGDGDIDLAVAEF